MRRSRLEHDCLPFPCLLYTSPGSYCIVSHNRSFLDPIVTKVLEFVPGEKPRVYLGNVSDYLEKVERAVSYTHLDVYKRQGYRLFTFPFSEKAGFLKYGFKAVGKNNTETPGTEACDAGRALNGISVPGVTEEGPGCCPRR